MGPYSVGSEMYVLVIFLSHALVAKLRSSVGLSDSSFHTDPRTSRTPKDRD